MLEPHLFLQLSISILFSILTYAYPAHSIRFSSTHSFVIAFKLQSFNKITIASETART